MCQLFNVPKSIIIVFYIGFLRVNKILAFPLEETNHFDSVINININPPQEIDYSVGSPANSWPFSFWQHRSTENAAELREFKSTLRDHNIIHLIARPLAVYYHDDMEILNTTKALRSKICRATIPATDTYHTLDTDESTLNILFICSTGTCCGLDCCHLRRSFVTSSRFSSLAIEDEELEEPMLKGRLVLNSTTNFGLILETQNPSKNPLHQEKKVNQ